MHRLPIATLTALAAAAALAGPAQAAPDWISPSDVGDGRTQFALPHVGYTDSGTELGTHFEVKSNSPLDIDLVATRRRAGSGYETELKIPTTATGVPIDATFDVAPNGAAVLAWAEVDPKAPEGPRRFRAAYRTPGGVWEPPTLIASDTSTADFVFPTLEAAIGDDGTAVAGATHVEADTPGEKQTDGRLDLAVHPPNGAWDSGTRLSPPDTHADFAVVGVDASGAATVTLEQRTSEGATSNLGDDDSTVIVRRYSPSNGLWNGPEDITGSKPRTHIGALRLAVAQTGRSVVAYQVSRDGGPITTEAARRSATTGAFGKPETADAAPDSSATAVGVAPDGTTYIVTSDSRNKNLGVTRASAAGSFSDVQSLGPAGIVPSGAVAFRGDDAFFGWDDDRDGVHAAIWPAGAPRPEAARDLDAGHPVRGFEQLESDRDGSVVAVWRTSGFTSRSATFDGGAPALTDENVPHSGQAGAPIAMSASFADFWSPLTGDPEWDFGDGTSATGGSVSHAYASAGSFTVTVRSRDARGNERTRTFPVTIGASAAATQPPADTAKPSVKIKLPSKKVRRKRSAWQTLTGTVADAAPSSGIARVEVTAFRPTDKRKKVRTAKLKGTTWKLRLPKLTRGAWTFRVRAVDGAGNVSKTVQQKVRLR